MPRPNGMICVRLPRDRRWIVSMSRRMSDTTLNSASTQIAASGLDASARHLLPWSLAAGWRRLPGYWVPAAQVLHGLAVLPLDGVFEQVRQVPAGGDAGDVGDPVAGPDRDDEP